jgi:hypothetical protein
MVNDLWVSKLRKAHVPSVSCWILNDSTGIVDKIPYSFRKKNRRSSPLLLQLFDFSTLYTKIDLTDLKAHVKVMINKEFNQIFNLHHFKFLVGLKNSFEL